MKNVISRISAILITGAMLAGFTACSDKDSASEHKGAHGDEGNQAGEMPSGDVAEEDLPYGATITQLLPSNNEGLNISVEYDNRFMSEEEARAVSDYLYALNTNDAELMAKTFYPPFLEYSYKNAGYSSAQEYLTAFTDNLKSTISEHVQKEVQTFTIDYIMIDDCLTSGDDKAGTDLDDMDRIIAESIGQEHVDKIDKASRKEVFVDFTYKVNNDSDSYDYNYGTGHTLNFFIYTIDGTCYII